MEFVGYAGLYNPKITYRGTVKDGENPWDYFHQFYYSDFYKDYSDYFEFQFIFKNWRFNIDLQLAMELI